MIANLSTSTGYQCILLQEAWIRIDYIQCDSGLKTIQTLKVRQGDSFFMEKMDPAIIALKKRKTL